MYQANNSGSRQRIRNMFALYRPLMDQLALKCHDSGHQLTPEVCRMLISHGYLDQHRQVIPEISAIIVNLTGIEHGQVQLY